MPTAVVFTITRSSEWLKQQAVELGISQKEKIEVSIEVEKLSAWARKMLLGDEHVYPHRYAGRRNGWKLCGTFGWTGDEPIVIDSHAPTAEQVDYALQAAQGRLDKLREDSEREDAIKLAEAERKEREEQARLQRVEDAKSILAVELEQLRKVMEANTLLSRVLAAIDEDTIREAVSSIVNEDAAKNHEELIDAIESAADTDYVIFGRD